MGLTGYKLQGGSNQPPALPRDLPTASPSPRGGPASFVQQGAVQLGSGGAWVFKPVPDVPSCVPGR